MLLTRLGLEAHRYGMRCAAVDGGFAPYSLLVRTTLTCFLSTGGFHAKPRYSNVEGAVPNSTGRSRFYMHRFSLFVSFVHGEGRIGTDQFVDGNGA